MRDPLAEGKSRGWTTPRAAEGSIGRVRGGRGKPVGPVRLPRAHVADLAAASETTTRSDAGPRSLLGRGPEKFSGFSLGVPGVDRSS